MEYNLQNTNKNKQPGIIMLNYTSKQQQQQQLALLLNKELLWF